jgi:hypothetical protein
MQLNPLNVDSDLLKIQPPVLTEFLQFEIHLIISGNLSCFVVFVVRPSGGELLQLATRRAGLVARSKNLIFQTRNVC